MPLSKPNGSCPLMPSDRLREPVRYLVFRAGLFSRI
jgi:hypothetical protein